MSTDVVLVHGKFSGPWCWDPIRPTLETQFQVVTPELPFTSLADDAALVADVVAASRSAGNQVLLLAHSYAGMVISAGGSVATQLVYLAALVPQPGQTNTQASVEAATSMREGVIVMSPDGSGQRKDGPNVEQAFYNLSPAAAVEDARRRSRPYLYPKGDEPVERPAWLTVPSMYVVCDCDNAVNTDYQRRWADRFGVSRVIHADHSPFLSAPAELAQVIAEAAQRLDQDAALGNGADTS